MSSFPSLTIEGVTISRVVCGTNALLGYSHVSPGRDAWIREHFTAKRIAQVFRKCQELGVTTVMGPLHPRLLEALQETEKLTGQAMIWLATTNMDVAPPELQADFDRARAEGRHADAMAISKESTAQQVPQIKAAGAPFCLFHGGWIDQWPIVDGNLVNLSHYTGIIRDAGLITGTATHISSRLTELDKGDHDLSLLVTPVNRGGWGMRPDRDAAVAAVNGCKRPVFAIKALACGRFETERDVEPWLEWVVGVQGLQGVVLGLMLEQEAEQSLPVLKAQFAKKFGA